MSEAHPSRSHLFIVRMWLEDLGDGEIKWRGKVQHVLSGQVRYIQDWSLLEKLLLEMLDKLRLDSD